LKDLLSTISLILRRVISYRKTSSLSRKYATVEPPLRAELFNDEQMERHGNVLAGSHRLRASIGPDQLLKRLAENEDVLVGTYNLLRSATKENRRITPGGEWLLDNFYLVEEQIRIVRMHFPEEYSRQLPILTNGASAELPRVYDIALEAVAHGDGRVDPESLSRFVAAYQQTSVLLLGELWAIPIMLRLALIENMQRVSARVATDMIGQNYADMWADKIIETVENDPKSLILVIADMAQAYPPLSNSFVAEFTRRLQGYSPALILPLNWIEQHLEESGLSSEKMIQLEAKNQAADQLSIRNIISSLRAIEGVDWRKFVESMSYVEKTLCQDPDGTYELMDFATRDSYRHVIERLSRKSGRTEVSVAQSAIELAQDSHEKSLKINGNTQTGRTSHVGHYLIGNGIMELEGALGTSPSWKNGIYQILRRHSLLLYLGTILLGTIVLTGVLLSMLGMNRLPGWALLLAAVPAMIGGSHFVISMVNWASTLIFSPRMLPRMDYSHGIPVASRTLVVVPAILTGIESIDVLAEELEVRFLANRDVNLHFGLLTDLRDADKETLLEDESLQQHVRILIENLNKKYDSESSASFFLFHRPRRWNEQEHIWMGYERKRGKLCDLNSLLRGRSRDAFSLLSGNLTILSQVKYVITLDSDTQLPRDAARDLVATLAHPLNRAHYDKKKNRVTEGYGILQPRLAASFSSNNRTGYTKMFSGESGVDPYTRAVSDVYQDLFLEGSFLGKGIYDVDIFEQAIRDQLPENRILSHDLLEGCYARSGLVSDVILYEDCPSRYNIDVIRRHRWIRGDWQIAAWLLPEIPGCKSNAMTSQDNPLTALSRWKILDNLRRSLVPASLTLLFIMGWIVIPESILWTVTIIGLISLGPLIAAGFSTFKKGQDERLSLHFMGCIRTGMRQFKQSVLTLVCLPFEAWYSLDAIIRTIVRILFTHKRLLEWNSSSEVERDHEISNGIHRNNNVLTGLIRTGSQMLSGPLTAIIVTVYLAHVIPAALIAAAPVLFLWLISPVVAWQISRPIQIRPVRLNADQIIFLRSLSRRTWAFFDQFVTAGEHWLPPDNFQEQPVSALAHRTSPTNIGLSLLANLSAYDFGYITTGNLIDRTANTLNTMSIMEKYRGHFYNWYDTLTLQPLPQLYISSVDSGNLAGHLLILRAGLLELPDEKIFDSRLFDGLLDTSRVVMDASDSCNSESWKESIAQLIDQIRSACDSRALSVSVTMHYLRDIEISIRNIIEKFDVDTNFISHPDLYEWLKALFRQCQDAQGSITNSMPWAALPPPPPRIHERFLNVRGFGLFPSLRDLLDLQSVMHAHTAVYDDATLTAAELEWISDVRSQIPNIVLRTSERIELIERLALEAGQLAKMDFAFLYNESRNFLTLGYNVEKGRPDLVYYDLLASEARLASFVAIAQGEIPQQNWFALGRLLTSSGGDSILLSWSGSMFEYLMPLLVMPSYENTLLHQTCLAAVRRQISYGQKRGVPWGISESAYNAVDGNLNYLYRAFGVPGSGLKRGLAEDLVVAPYASALALMVLPDAACQNLQRLAEEGLLAQYGMYEAVDLTPKRVPRGEQRVIIQSFMAHHQAMSLLAFSHILLDRPMHKRFDSDPHFKATVLLLQERIPKTSAFLFHTPEHADAHEPYASREPPIRVLHTADTAVPEVQLLSNGHYHVMVTNAGGGFSRWDDYAVTRWREDGTCDNWGAFFYLRDLSSGEFWSATHQPTLKQADSYEAILSESRVEFRRRDRHFETHLEISVSPEDDIELRRIRITNRTRSRRSIEVTSYAEVVIAPVVSDLLHPAFSKLFVQTEIIRDQEAIICNRRPRSSDENAPWMFHLMAVHDGTAENVSYETDRQKFIGRTRSITSPQALMDPGPLSCSEGAVLDPVVAIRQVMAIGPGETVIIDVVTGIGKSRDSALKLVGKYRDMHLASRVFSLAWAHSWVNLQQINATEADAQLFGRMASSIIYANPTLRADASIISSNLRNQSNLWGYSISGDLPIVLLQISEQSNIELLRKMLQAHIYWRQKGLAVDLIIWNEANSGYRQPLQEQIIGLIASGSEANLSDYPGGIFVRISEQISVEDRILIQAIARVIITDSKGSLFEQVNRLNAKDKFDVRVARLVPSAPADSEKSRRTASSTEILSENDLQFFNGYGGFSMDGREYVTTVRKGHVPPAPWVNVIANSNFGTVISESGTAYTWGENAHEFRLTPWSNDPVCDQGGEAIYIRDEESGHFWSPTLLPSGGNGSYGTRHGFGYSIFEHNEDGINTELTVHVDREASIKFSILKIRNDTGRIRRLSATGYVEWVLGDLPEKSSMHVVTFIDSMTGALCARNRYRTGFYKLAGFFDADFETNVDDVTVTGDRTEFIGRNGTLQNPAAMLRSKLSNNVGAGMAPCGAIQIPFEIADGQERQIIFRLGVERWSSSGESDRTFLKLKGSSVAHQSLHNSRQYWIDTLGTIQVETPDPSLDVLANGWLMYQTIVCRMWARSGFYQSSGAYGFRDQLQDSMAVVHAAPDMVREHLLRCASRQFMEGDVQHWWHSNSGQGVRTHCSDDFLWLPQAVCRYIDVTGDSDVLNEMVPFLLGRPLSPSDDSYYDLPTQSGGVADLYQHCVRAILWGLRFGEYGLPLMGTGDWNDGMNRVGMGGKGESVWLGFFLYDTLIRFARISELRSDTSFAVRCRREASLLLENIELHAWDGEWYRRAWFDDGTPLGSSINDECQIDSISQSWSVLSGAGGQSRTQTAMDALDQRLVLREHSLIKIFTPPFNNSSLDPGYIKGYVPGVRENGGQYTHSAIWSAMAFAMLRDRSRAWELFNMINPIRHANSEKEIAIYKVEPYVIAADVYAISPHIGRGGWTWYTGSAGLMYRLIFESLLGFRIEGNRLRIDPCLPKDWSGFKIRYRYHDTCYVITISQPAGGTTEDSLMSLTLDGIETVDQEIILIDDHREHNVQMSWR